VAVIALAALVAGSVTFAVAAPKRLTSAKDAKGKAAKGKVKARHGGPNVVGTIVYDTGVPNAGFHPGPKNNAGNRFNSDMGGPLLMTGQLTMIAFFPNVSGTGFVTAFGPPDGAGVAPNLGSFGVSGIVPNQFNTVSVGAIPVGPDFLAGAWETTTLRQGMDNMSVAPQGFHAFDLNTNFPNSGTGFAAIPGQNALVRATGNILVPVELMNFQVK
jgi:hypothetical protein